MIGAIASSFLLIAIRSSFRKYGRGYIPGSDAFKRSKGKTGKGVGWKNPKRSGAKGRGGALGGNVWRGARAPTGLKGVMRARII
ncbi:hypothetical protein HDU81_006936 [Chytriomyces hyalinus]|nr:hypothetical protein HDU81_006936 [Chytriomyces hyalinus]KAJ3244513.1 hypothetical protein HDU78_010820 [Chytriomyces hyalinus]